MPTEVPLTWISTDRTPKSAIAAGDRIFLQLLLWSLLFAGYSSFFVFSASVASATKWQMGISTVLNSLFLFTLLQGIFFMLRLFGTTLVQWLLLAFCGLSIPLLVLDFLVFQQFKFHINSFVLKVILQPNIFETLNLGWREGATALLVLAVGMLVVLAVWRGTAVVGGTPLRKAVAGPWRKLGICLLIFLATLGDKAFFAWQLFQVNTEIYLVGRRVPLYIPVQMSRGFEEFGFTKPQAAGPVDTRRSQTVRYPLQPVSFPEAQPSYPNIVLLISEKMRHDIINLEVTPRIQQHVRCCFSKFRNHYSAANDSAGGLFGMFYSLPANYQDAFGKAQVTPVLLDLLEARNYEFALLAKEDLGYFGTDEIIFNKLRSHIRDRFPSEAEMIDHALGVLESRKQRKTARPLFLLIIHDAPHHPQFVSEQYQRFQPAEYMPLFNPDLPEHQVRAANQFKNAYTLVDDEMGRMLDALKDHGYFDNSVVVVTGDHGHEQYEHGYWGHASAFTKEQTQVSFFLHLPGQVEYEEVSRLTSHLDLVPTFLEVLNEPLPLQHFALGESLLSPAKREYIMMGGMANSVLFDGRVKIDYTPFEGIALYRVVDQDDEPLADSDAVIVEYTPLLLDMFEKLGRFYR